MTLAGRTALVTGASRGIGAAIATRLAADGAQVVLTARSRSALDTLGATLSGRAIAIEADLRSTAAIAALVGQLAARRLVPDLLVLNAGLFAVAPVGTLTLEAADAMIDLNLRAPYHLLHHLLGGLRTRGAGDVVTVGSVADRVAFAENGMYAATKFAARGLHEVLRAELRGTGVRTTLISPGPVDTPIWDPVDAEGRPGYPPRSAMLRPDDVADAVAWVVSRPPHVTIEQLRLARS